MDRARKIENILFIGIVALLGCAVLLTFALAQIGILSIEPAALVRGEVAVPSTAQLRALRQYDQLFELVRVGITDFSRKWLPGYDRLLESNTRMTIATNRALYGAVFGDEYQYLPITSIPEGSIFVDKDQGYLFIMKPDAKKDPAGAVQLVNSVAERHPELNAYVYVIQPLWLSPLMNEQDAMFESPFYFVDALGDLDPSIPSGALRFDSLDEYLSGMFKTDHHWNMEGAYRGYTEVLDLMRSVHPDIGQPLPMQPERAQTMDGFRGLLASVAAYDNLTDTITDGGIEAPPHTLSVRSPSGKILTFSSVAETRKELFDGTRAPGKYEDLYQSFFMPTELYLWYDYPGNSTNRRLLAMSDSSRKCIIEALASHYDQTYVVDVRYQTDFRFDAFALEHGITDVLFMYGDSFNDLTARYADCF